jgi:hypothetical protein
MTIEASGRSAAILATGFLLCFAGLAQAAGETDDAGVDAAVSSEGAAGAPIVLDRFARHGAPHLRSHTHLKSPRLELKSPAAKKAADVAEADGATSTKISASVAGASAQMISTDTPAGSGKAMSAQANNILHAAADTRTDTPLAAETQVVSSDQLNDIDRSLQESKPFAATFAIASADTAMTADKNESSIWDRTSPIGKIFIGFGVLLTVASAARMFMA